MRIICINGAPGSGKDTCGELIKELYDNARVVKFAHPLDRIAKNLLVMSDANFEYFRNDGKECLLTPWRCQVTMRKLLISISEDLIKPNFGNTWFADQCASYITNTSKQHDLVVVTDSGFQYEFDYFKDRLNEYADIKLVQLTRTGHTFDNDSRETVSDGEDTIYINNDGTMDELKSLLSVELFQ